MSPSANGQCARLAHHATSPLETMAATTLLRPDPQQRYLLWDTSVLLGYYVPEAATNDKAAKRAQVLIDSVRHQHSDIHFYIPNIVVAEVFTQLARLCYSTWDPQIYKKFGGKGKALHTATYRAAKRRFRRDIHNGALFYQYELNRYHILGLDLIAPVDKYRKFYRKGQVRSMGAADLLMGAMAMHLTRLHGRASVALVTSDRRMDAIFANACGALNKNTAHDLGLVSASQELGFGKWDREIYPQVLDLARCSDTRLKDWFGAWPLADHKVPRQRPRA
jgi:hypothetical protein